MESGSVPVTTYSFEPWGPFPSTRAWGLRSRQELEALLPDIPEGEPLVLDFTGIEALTVAFADEVLAKLVSRFPQLKEPSSLKIVGANPEVRATLRTALERRKLELNTLTL
jgi:hypothetical protein